MDELQNLTKIDFGTVFISVVAILVAIKFLIILFEWFIDKFGLETKGMRQKRENQELLIKTAQGLTELRNTHEEDKVQSIRHDEMIREDLKSVVVIVNNISDKLVIMQEKDDAIEMAKLKEKILGYYRKYAPLGEWEKFEADVFWGLYDNYINRGGNSFVKDDIEPVMRNLKFKD